MELVIRKFDSFEAAEPAEIEEDIAMPPEQRIEVLLAIRARLYDHADQQGFARVSRIIQRERS